MKPVLAEVQPDKCPGPRTQSGGPHSLTPLKVDAVFLLSRPSPATLTLLVVVRGVVCVWCTSPYQGSADNTYKHQIISL